MCGNHLIQYWQVQIPMYDLPLIHAAYGIIICPLDTNPSFTAPSAGAEELGIQIDPEASSLRWCELDWNVSQKCVVEKENIFLCVSEWEFWCHVLMTTHVKQDHKKSPYKKSGVARKMYLWLVPHRWASIPAKEKCKYERRNIKYKAVFALIWNIKRFNRLHRQMYSQKN